MTEQQLRRLQWAVSQISIQFNLPGELIDWQAIAFWRQEIHRLSLQKDAS